MHINYLETNFTLFKNTNPDHINLSYQNRTNVKNGQFNKLKYTDLIEINYSGTYDP